MDEEKYKELEKAAQPLIDFLRKYYSPMAKAVVTEGAVHIYVVEMAQPLELQD